MAGKYLCQVEHPEHSTVTVTADDNAGAVMEASKTWDVPFREIAGDCRITVLGSALLPRCRRCHSEFGSPGDPNDYCPACLELMDRQKRETVRYAVEAKAREKRLKEMEQ